jgi:hypothetical protein
VHLDLRNTLIGKKIAPSIFKRLIPDRLKVLDLTGVTPFTGAENGNALSDFLGASTVIEKLVVSGVGFDRESYKGFLHGVKISKTLSRIEMDAVNVEKCPLGPLRDTLRQVPTVRELSLRKCTNLGKSRESVFSLLLRLFM